MIIAGVIFDLDGTIVNSTEVQWYAFNEYLHQFKIKISWIEWINEYLGEKSEEIWYSIFNKHKLNVNIESAQKERRAIYKRLVDEGKLMEIEGFTEFYNWLKTVTDPSTHFVIASNGHPSSIETSLKAIGYFKKIRYFSAEHGTKMISKSDLLKIVTKELKLNPSQCLVFEDSVLGVKASKELGIRTIVINTSNLPKESFCTDFIVNNYSDPALFLFIKKLINLEK